MYVSEFANDCSILSTKEVYKFCQNLSYMLYANVSLVLLAPQLSTIPLVLQLLEG